MGYIQAKRICFSPADKNKSTCWVRLPRQVDGLESKGVKSKIIRTHIGVKVPASLRLHKGNNNVQNDLIKEVSNKQYFH